MFKHMYLHLKAFMNDSYFRCGFIFNTAVYTITNGNKFDNFFSIVKFSIRFVFMSTVQ